MHAASYRDSRDEDRDACARASPETSLSARTPSLSPPDAIPIAFVIVVALVTASIATATTILGTAVGVVSAIVLIVARSAATEIAVAVGARARRWWRAEAVGIVVGAVGRGCDGVRVTTHARRSRVTFERDATVPGPSSAASVHSAARFAGES